MESSAYPGKIYQESEEIFLPYKNEMTEWRVNKFGFSIPEPVSTGARFFKMYNAGLNNSSRLYSNARQRCREAIESSVLSEIPGSSQQMI